MPFLENSINGAERLKLTENSCETEQTDVMGVPDLQYP